MRRIARELAIPLIVLASYGGYRLAKSDQAQAFFTDARSRVERVIEEHRERQVERGSTVSDAIERFFTNAPTLTAARAPVPQAEAPESNTPELALARPTSAYETVEDTIRARVAKAPEPREAERVAIVEPPARHPPATRSSEPVLEHVIETRPAYTLSEWQVSTLARIKPIETIVEGIAQRYGTDPTTVYATLIVESSLNPIATNLEEDKYGLAQVRPTIIEQLVASEGSDQNVSLLSPKDNLDVYTASLDWISHETGVEDFVTLSAIHSYTGPERTLEAYLSSEHLSTYRSLVQSRIPFVTSVIDACETQHDDLEAICSIDGDVAQRYRALTDASIERAASTTGMRSAVHYANAVLSLRAYEEMSSMRPASRAELARLERRLEIETNEERAYASEAASHLGEPLGERYTIERSP